MITKYTYFFLQLWQYAITAGRRLRPTNTKNCIIVVICTLCVDIAQREQPPFLPSDLHCFIFVRRRVRWCSLLSNSKWNSFFCSSCLIFHLVHERWTFLLLSVSVPFDNVPMSMRVCVCACVFVSVYRSALERLPGANTAMASPHSMETKILELVHMTCICFIIV